MTADTPDIVERLTRGLSATRCGLCLSPNISDADIREAADTILALRAEEQRLLRQVELRTRFKQTTRTLPTVEILP